jgi:hypothetical protein
VGSQNLRGLGGFRELVLDEATDVILLYLESFGNPRRFDRLEWEVGRTC